MGNYSEWLSLHKCEFRLANPFLSCYDGATAEDYGLEFNYDAWPGMRGPFSPSPRTSSSEHGIFQPVFVDTIPLITSSVGKDRATWPDVSWDYVTDHKRWCLLT
jgi:hypothetical protein